MQDTLPSPEPGGAPLTVLAALDPIHHTHFMASFQRILWAYVALATLASGLLGWLAARNGLSPLRAMKARAQAVSAHKLDERMPVDAVPVEMADLARSLNDMLVRLQADFERLSAFSSDLAHELRTPISNLLTETQVTLSQRRTVNESMTRWLPTRKNSSAWPAWCRTCCFWPKPKMAWPCPNRSRLRSMQRPARCASSTMPWQPTSACKSA